MEGSYCSTSAMPLTLQYDGTNVGEGGSSEEDSDADSEERRRRLSLKKRSCFRLHFDS